MVIEGINLLFEQVPESVLLLQEVDSTPDIPGKGNDLLFSLKPMDELEDILVQHIAIIPLFFDQSGIVTLRHLLLRPVPEYLVINQPFAQIDALRGREYLEDQILLIAALFL